MARNTRDTVDFLENLLGTVGHVASSIEKGSEKRNKVYVMRINDIIGTSGGGTPNYRRYTDNAEIDNIKGSLVNIQDEINSSGDVVTQQYFNSILDDIEIAKGDNTKFYAGKLKFTNSDPDNPGLEEILLEKMNNYMNMQTSYAGPVPEEKMVLAVDDIKDILFQYAREKENYISYFGERVTKDTTLLNSITSVETYANFVLQQLLVPEDGGKAYIDEETYHTFREGLFEGNFAALEEHIKGENVGRGATINTLIESLGNDYVEFIKYEQDRTAMFGSGDEGFRKWAIAKDIKIETDLQLEAARHEYNTSLSKFNTTFINPIKNRMDGNDKNLIKLTGNSYLDQLTGLGTIATNKLILPGEITDNIAKYSKNPRFARFNKSSLDGIYESIVNEIAFKKSRDEEWRENKTIYDTLLTFEALYDTINLDIGENEGAKNAGYKSIIDVDAYKNINIEEIRRLIKEMEAHYPEG